MIVDELVTLLTFESTHSSDKAIQEREKQIEKIKEAVKETSEAILGMAKSFLSFVGDVNKATTDIYEWSKAMSVSSDAYQQLGYVVESFGGSLEDVKDDLEAIAGYIPPEQQFEYFAKLADSVENFGSEYEKRMAVSFIKNEELRRAVMAGGAEFRKLGANAIVLNQEQLKSSEALTKSLREIQSIWKSAVYKTVADVFRSSAFLLSRISEMVKELIALITPLASKYMKSLGVVLAGIIVPLAEIIRVLAMVIRFLDWISGGTASWVLAIGAAIVTVWALAFAISVLAFKSFVALKLSFTQTTLAFARWQAMLFKSSHAYRMVTLATKNLVNTLWSIIKPIAVGTWHIIKNVAAWIWHKAVVIISTAITWAMVAAQWALNAAFLASPIGWVVIAIAALIAIVVLLIKYWSNVIDVWKRVWTSIVEGCKVIWDWMKSAWESISSFFTNMFDRIKNIWDWFNGLAGGLGSFLLWVNPITAPIKALLKAWEAAKKIYEWFKGKKLKGEVDIETTLQKPVPASIGSGVSGMAKYSNYHYNYTNSSTRYGANSRTENYDVRNQIVVNTNSSNGRQIGNEISQELNRRPAFHTLGRSGG